MTSTKCCLLSFGLLYRFVLRQVDLTIFENFCKLFVHGKLLHIDEVDPCDGMRNALVVEEISTYRKGEQMDRGLDLCQIKT